MINPQCCACLDYCDLLDGHVVFEGDRHDDLLDDPDQGKAALFSAAEEPGKKYDKGSK